jgi:hypothetical protein
MPARTVPQGVTCGAGVINFVNTLHTNDNTNDNGYHSTGGYIEPEFTINYVARYCNFTAAGSAFHSIAMYDPTLPQTYNTGRASFTVEKCLYGHMGYSFYYGFREPLNLILDDKGTDAGIYGPAVYPHNYAPIPTDHVITVGVDKDYATLYDAYMAAEHGDNIVLDPGDHDVYKFGATTSVVTLNKCVRIYGATQNPADVRIYKSSGNNDGSLLGWDLFSMTNVPEDFRGPGFFHVWLDLGNTGSVWWRSTIRFGNTTGDTHPWDPDTDNIIVGELNGNADPDISNDIGLLLETSYQGSCPWQSSSRCVLGRNSTTNVIVKVV